MYIITTTNTIGAQALVSYCTDSYPDLKWRCNDTVILVRNPMSLALGYWYVRREFELRLAYVIFAHQADAMENKHGLSKCIHHNPISLGWHRSLHSWSLSMDKWMRKASIHRYYRYVKRWLLLG
jgi:hypothetical protein